MSAVNHILDASVTVRKHEFKIPVYSDGHSVFYGAKALYNMTGSDYAFNPDKFTIIDYDGENIHVVDSADMSIMMKYAFDADNVPDSTWRDIHKQAYDEFRFWKLETEMVSLKQMLSVYQTAV